MTSNRCFEGCVPAGPKGMLLGDICTEWECTVGEGGRRSSGRSPTLEPSKSHSLAMQADSAQFSPLARTGGSFRFSNNFLVL